MENCDNLSLADATGIAASADPEILSKIALTVTSLLAKGNFMNLAHKAQLKSGLSYIQSGDLSRLTGAQLDRLIEVNTPPSLYIKSPVYIARVADPNQGAFRTLMNQRIADENAFGKNNVVPLTNASGLKTDGTNAALPKSLKDYIPWILGAIVVAALIYFITKK